MKFVEKNGYVPRYKYKDDKIEEYEQILGAWCATQRQFKKKGFLTKERIEELDKIKLWFWEREDTFDELYDELVNWVKANKTIPRARTKTDMTEYKLGEFSSRMRKNKKDGKLDKDRIEKLEKINGWYWTNDDIRVIQTFDEKLKDITTWINKNNKIPSKSKNKDDNEESRLGRLCEKLRSKYKKGKLTDDEIKELEKIPNWYWETGVIVKSFDENYKDLKKWLNEHNVMPSRCYYSEGEGKRLGRWVEKQKTAFKNGELTKEDYEKFEKLPYWNVYHKNGRKPKK